MRVTRRYVLGETCGTCKVSQRLFGGALGSSDYTATYDRFFLLTVHLSIILVINQLDAQNLVL